MATASPPSSPRAMADALSIPELHEAILLRLDMATLLVSASRVNKHWQRTITDSPKLQEKLFFKPVSASAEHSPSGTTPVTNPLLADKFGKCFFDTDGTYGYYHRTSSFQDLLWSGGRIKQTPLDRSKRPGIANINEDPEATTSRRRFTRSGASWRRMLVSQPPPPLAGYLRMDQDGSKTAISTALVEPAPGIGEGVGLCMGQLYDMVQCRASLPTECSVWFRVTWHRPREPVVLPFCYETGQKLLDQTCLLTEFHHVDDGYGADPVNTDKFHAAFRCDDFQPPDFTAELIRESDFDLVEWSTRAAVYDQKWYPFGFYI